MRLTTGVPGFDDMVEGGLPLGSSVVLQGPPGHEKLRFALMFLAEGLNKGASGLVVVSSFTPEEVLGALQDLGVDLEAVDQDNRLRVVDWHAHRVETVLAVEERGLILRSSVDLTNVGVALSRAIGSLAEGGEKRAVVELLSPAASSYGVKQAFVFAQGLKPVSHGSDLQHSSSSRRRCTRPRSVPRSTSPLTGLSSSSAFGRATRSLTRSGCSTSRTRRPIPPSEILRKPLRASGCWVGPRGWSWPGRESKERM